MWLLGSCSESSKVPEKKTPIKSSTPIRLTNNAVDESTPAWSPDDEQIAFTAFTQSDFEIYAMNTDGTGLTDLSNNPTPDMPGFAWSPDGEKIAFVSNFRTGEYSSDIYIMNADGSNQVRLTKPPLEPIPGISWSPNGKEIAFTSGSLYGDIYVIDADGSSPTNLTNSRTLAETSPAWSPDGKEIAFCKPPNSQSMANDIYVMAADGSNPRNLTDHLAKDNVLSRSLADVDDCDPAWSPDGKKIAFSSNRRINSEIYVMDANGSNLASLTRNRVEDWSPSWSPDGHKIVFVSDRDRPPNAISVNEIYVMNVYHAN